MALGSTDGVRVGGDANPTQLAAVLCSSLQIRLFARPACFVHSTNVSKGPVHMHITESANMNW